MRTPLAVFTLAGFWAFFGFGFIDNLKGPLLPEIVRSGAMNYAQAGTFIFMNYLGFILATLGSGLLADRLSHRLVLWWAGWCLLAGLVGVGWCTSILALTACMFVMGLGLGGIELGANGLMIQLHPRDRGRYLNLLSVFHGCGSFIVPLVAAGLIDAGWIWKSIYALCSLAALPLLVLFLPIPLVQVPGSQPTSNAPVSPASMSLLKIGFTPIMWGYYVLIASYVATELSIGAWMMEYLQKRYEFSVDQSSRYLSAFFVMLMLGRLLGAWIVERFDYLRVVGLALLATGLCVAAGLWLGQQFLFCLPLSGLCMSVIFPTVTASVSRLHPQNSGAVIGLLFGFSGIGGAVGPWLVGLASQSYGLPGGMSLTLAYNLTALFALFWLNSNLRVR